MVDEVGVQRRGLDITIHEMSEALWRLGGSTRWFGWAGVGLRGGSCVEGIVIFVSCLQAKAVSKLPVSQGSS